jgi:hypothetical protein
MSPRSPYTLPLLALALAALGHARVHAEEEITTDRPDVVESTDVVSHVQIETGLQDTRAKADGVQARTFTTPVLLRFGLSHALELRVETDGYTDATTTGPGAGDRVHDQGMSDTSLGLKWRAQESDESGRPAIAWLVDVAAPTGSVDFRGQGWRPSLRLVSEWDLPHDFSLGVMPGITLDRADDGHVFANGQFSVSLDNAIAPHWDAFVELAAQQITARRYGGDVVTFDTGVAHRLSADFQLDAAVFLGLTHEAPALSWTVGASYRF